MMPWWNQVDWRVIARVVGVGIAVYTVLIVLWVVL